MARHTEKRSGGDGHKLVELCIGDWCRLFISKRIADDFEHGYIIVAWNETIEGLEAITKKIVNLNVNFDVTGTQTDKDAIDEMQQQQRGGWREEVISGCSNYCEQRSSCIDKRHGNEQRHTLVCPPTNLYFRPICRDAGTLW